MNVPFLDRFRVSDLVGMDMGRHAVKFLRFRDKADAVVACCYRGHVGAKGEKEVRELRDFLEANHLAGAPVACGVDEDSLKFKRMELPKMPDSDLKEAVRWQMRDAVEGPVSDYIVRHHVLYEYVSSEGRRVALLGYAIPSKDVRALTQFLRACSLKPVAVEPSSISLLAAFEDLRGFEKGQHYGVVDLGHTKSLFAAVGDGGLLFTRPLSGVSGLELRGLLAGKLSIAEDVADSLARLLLGEGTLRNGLDSLRNQAEALLASYATRVAIEVQRSIDAFSLMFQRAKIDRIFLCGGGAALAGLKDYLSKNIAVPTDVLDPSARCGTAMEMPHLYNVAYGLARYPL